MFRGHVANWPNTLWPWVTRQTLLWLVPSPRSSTGTRSGFTPPVRLVPPFSYGPSCFVLISCQSWWSQWYFPIVKVSLSTFRMDESTCCQSKIECNTLLYLCTFLYSQYWSCYHWSIILWGLQCTKSSVLYFTTITTKTTTAGHQTHSHECVEATLVQLAFGSDHLGQLDQKFMTLLKLGATLLPGGFQLMCPVQTTQCCCVVFLIPLHLHTYHKVEYGYFIFSFCIPFFLYTLTSCSIEEHTHA